MDFQLYEVGGRVRDKFLGLDSKDIEEGYHSGTRKPKSSFGTLEDDLIRRDFTVNAMAENAQGDIIDLFDGMSHLKNGLLRTPTDSVVSFNQDPLRILRAFRFAITKQLCFSDDIVTAIKLFQSEKMSVVSQERIREELTKMFKHDTLLTLRYLRWLEDMNPKLHRIVLSNGMWLMPTTKI